MAPYENVEIIPGDALKLDLAALAAEKLPSLRPLVCANLPYNITTPVLTKLVETPCFESITVLLQKEVARRLAAAQGSSDGGAFTLESGWPFFQTQCFPAYSDGSGAYKDYLFPPVMKICQFPD